MSEGKRKTPLLQLNGLRFAVYLLVYKVRMLPRLSMTQLLWRYYQGYAQPPCSSMIPQMASPLKFSLGNGGPGPRHFIEI